MNVGSIIELLQKKSLQNDHNFTTEDHKTLGSFTGQETPQINQNIHCEPGSGKHGQLNKIPSTRTVKSSKNCVETPVHYLHVRPKMVHKQSFFSAFFTFVLPMIMFILGPNSQNVHALSLIFVKNYTTMFAVVGSSTGLLINVFSELP